jgi:sulfate adenylyltransferase subunit 2
MLAASMMTQPATSTAGAAGYRPMNHLDQLEAESVHIIRETVAGCEKPVMLFSVGKDSAVMLHLAKKAFAPGKPPFPLMHVDTGFKFPAMYEYRDRQAAEAGMELIVWQNHAALEERGRGPECWNCTDCADQLKRQALVEGLTHHGFDAAFGGARRDEEKSRAKERVLSFRDKFQQWDPKNQRPELWDLYNTRHGAGESFRCFPISNWTELDIWAYIQREAIEIVPLYYADNRPVIRRDGMLIYAGDIMKPREGEVVEQAMIRFRTLGCQICTGAVESGATTLDAIVAEVAAARNSERENRAVDKDKEGSMEEKKRDGYF